MSGGKPPRPKRPPRPPKVPVPLETPSDHEITHRITVAAIGLLIGASLIACLVLPHLADVSGGTGAPGGVPVAPTPPVAQDLGSRGGNAESSGTGGGETSDGRKGLRLGGLPEKPGSENVGRGGIPKDVWELEKMLRRLVDKDGHDMIEHIMLGDPPQNTRLQRQQQLEQQALEKVVQRAVSQVPEVELRAEGANVAGTLTPDLDGGDEKEAEVGGLVLAGLPFLEGGKLPKGVKSAMENIVGGLAHAISEDGKPRNEAPDDLKEKGGVGNAPTLVKELKKVVDGVKAPHLEVSKASDLGAESRDRGSNAFAMVAKARSAKGGVEVARLGEGEGEGREGSVQGGVLAVANATSEGVGHEKEGGHKKASRKMGPRHTARMWLQVAWWSE